MIRISHSIVINRPVSEVFRFMTVAGNIFKYSRGTEEVHDLTPGDIGVGSRFEIVSRFMGRRVATVVEVTAFDAERGIESKAIKGPFQLRSMTTFRADGESTVVSFESEIVPTGFWRSLEPILPAIIRKRYEAEYEALRHVLETEMHRVDEHIEIVSLSKTMVLLEH